MKEEKNIQLASSRKFVIRNINATLFTPISRIKTLRDDKGFNKTVGQALPDNKGMTSNLKAPLIRPSATPYSDLTGQALPPLNGEGTSSPLRERMHAGQVRGDEHTLRHAEESLLNISTTLEKHGRDPEQKPLRMALLSSTSSAFTLIEMLVVVLIMGILAAIALPQYQKAVDKARFTEALVYFDVIKTAEEAYYLAYHKYTQNLDELDIKLPYTRQGSYSYQLGENGKCHADMEHVDSIRGSSTSTSAGNFFVSCTLKKGVSERVSIFTYMDHATIVNGGERQPIPAAYQQRFCMVLSGYGSSVARAEHLCKSFGTTKMTLPTNVSGWPIP